MPNMTEILCAIERRAERALVQELRLMTQEILTMRTQLTLEHRAHADALLLKLDHLARCQLVDTVAPCPAALSTPPAGSGLPALALDTLEPLQPSGYLVHFYGHELGDLERVEFTESLSSAAQLVRQHLADRPRPVWRVTRDAGDGALSFLAHGGMHLACIRPCEPSMPDVEPLVAEACAALTGGDLTPLRRLFIASAQSQPQPLAA